MDVGEIFSLFCFEKWIQYDGQLSERVLDKKCQRNHDSLHKKPPDKQSLFAYASSDSKNANDQKCDRA